MKQCIILNPNASTAAKAQDRLAAIGSHQLLVTREPGDATRFARQAVDEGYERVVAAGGDGTLNEVLNGLADRLDRVEMGLLPLGTANDFARTVGIPPDVDAALKILETGQTRQLDIVKLAACNCPAPHYFMNVSAGGFSTKVGKKVEKATKVTWGALGYAISAVKAFPDLEPYEVTLRFDDEEPASVLVYNVAVANARYVGGGVPVAPVAELDDGQFDVVLFRAVTLARLMTLVPKVALGEHSDDDDVLYRRARKFEISSEPPFELNTDGEIVGECPATFEIVPQAVKFVVGPEPQAVM